MSPEYHFLFLLFSHLVLLVLAGGEGNGYQGECPPSFNCGYLGNISFPFTITERQDCGLLAIHNCDDPLKNKTIQLQNKGKWFVVVTVSQPPRSPTIVASFLFRDYNFYQLLQSKSCEAFRYNCTLPATTFPFVSLRIKINETMFLCNRTLHVRPPTSIHKFTGCPDYDLYYKPFIYADNASLSALTACTMVQLPIKDVADSIDPFTFVTADISTEVKLTEECAHCHYTRRGRCQLDSNKRFFCANGILQQKPWKHKHP